MGSRAFPVYFPRPRILLYHFNQKLVISFYKNGKFQSLQKMSFCLNGLQNQALFNKGAYAVFSFDQTDLRRLLERLLILLEAIGQSQLTSMSQTKALKNSLLLLFLSHQKINFQQIIDLLNSLFSQLKLNFSQDIELCRALFKENQSNKKILIECQSGNRAAKTELDLNIKYEMFRKKISKKSMMVDTNQEKQSKKEVKLPVIDSTCSHKSSSEQTIEVENITKDVSNKARIQKLKKKKIQKKHSLLMRKNTCSVLEPIKQRRSLTKMVNNVPNNKTNCLKKSQHYYERAQQQLLRRRRLIQSKYCKSQNNIPVSNLNFAKQQYEVIHKRPQIVLFKRIVRELGYLNV